MKNVKKYRIMVVKLCFKVNRFKPNLHNMIIKKYNHSKLSKEVNLPCPVLTKFFSLMISVIK